MKLENDHRSTKKANLNNIAIKEDKFLELIEALRHNSSLEELAIANTTLSDFAAANLACALENNIRLERINLESNNVSPGTMVKIFEVNVFTTHLTIHLATYRALYCRYFDVFL